MPVKTNSLCVINITTILVGIGKNPFVDHNTGICVEKGWSKRKEPA